MTIGYPCQHFSIGLPVTAEDQSLAALFQHVAKTLSETDAISMDDLIAIGFETEVGLDAVTRGAFTVVFSDPERRAEQSA